MHTKVENQDLNCPTCHTGGKKHLFKVSGQSRPKCADCLAKHMSQQSVGKNVELNGLSHVPEGMGNGEAMVDSFGNLQAGPNQA